MYFLWFLRRRRILLYPYKVTEFIEVILLLLWSLLNMEKGAVVRSAATQHPFFHFVLYFEV
jgi:hypothetical protein